MSIIVPAYNERGTLMTILARLVTATLPTTELEVVIVNDGSDDGSRKLLDRFSEDPFEVLHSSMGRLKKRPSKKDLARVRFKVVHHERNQGKTQAIRTALEHVTGAYTVIQDADLEYDPAEIPRLLEPILAGKADVVYGSRFLGASRRVLYFWHAVGNRLLTGLSNLVTNLNLTDVETGYKAFRTDILTAINLKAEQFGFEVEVTAKLARLNVRLYEVPITYSGRSYVDGKKVRWWHGLSAMGQVLRYGLIPGRALKQGNEQQEALEDLAGVTTLTRYMYEAVRPALGDKILEVGAGTGNMTAFLLQHGEVVATDINGSGLHRLTNRFGDRGNLSVFEWDVADPFPQDRIPQHGFDTVVCMNVLEHIEDDGEALNNMRRCMRPGGKLVLLVPQGMWLYGPFDEKIGHYRRYKKGQLMDLLAKHGFDVSRCFHFNALGVPGWWVNSRILKRDHLSRGLLGVYERISPPILWMEKKVGLPYGISLISIGRKEGLDPVENVPASESSTA